MANLFDAKYGKVTSAVGKFAEAGLTAELADEILKNPSLAAVGVEAIRAALGVGHTIDLDSAPFIPAGWTLAEPEYQIASRATGTISWDPAKVELHLDPAQKSGGGIVGTELAKNLEGQPVLPANVLDHLLDHPALIPSDWKGKYVYFWGTVYRDSDGDLCVRYLCWSDGHWDWSYDWLVGDWGGRIPAAVLAG